MRTQKELDDIKAGKVNELTLDYYAGLKERLKSSIK